jgi:CBS domain-containing protein
VIENSCLKGVLTITDALELQVEDGRHVGDLVSRTPVVAYPWERLRAAADRMASVGVGRLPVVEGHGSMKVVGMLTRSDLLKAIASRHSEENQLERHLGPLERVVVAE